jgi:diacylglycerol kinase family enzyme
MPDPFRTFVIFNPAAGRGRALRIVEKRRLQHLGTLELWPTAQVGHAEELARQAADAGFERVVAAGGDGTVHEVANGLLASGNRDVIFAVWPMGSANDYAHSLGVTGGPAQVTQIRAVDVGRVEAPGGRSRYFVNGLGIGFNGAVTLEARKINWLRGIPLYSLAVLKAMVRHFNKPMMRVEFGQRLRETPTLALTINIGQREGGFPITPNAELTDELFDTMHAGPVSRWDLLRHFPNLVRGTLPADHPRMWLDRCRRVAVESTEPMRVHVDGEFFYQPEDKVERLEVTLLPGRLRVEMAKPQAAS